MTRKHVLCSICTNIEPKQQPPGDKRGAVISVNNPWVSPLLEEKSVTQVEHPNSRGKQFKTIQRDIKKGEGFIVEITFYFSERRRLQGYWFNTFFLIFSQHFFFRTIVYNKLLDIIILLPDK